MHPGNADSRHPHLWAILILVTGVVVTWLAYAPGLGGSFHFDDYPNLEGLANVADAGSAFHFVINGMAGPLGRPLALASFVPEAHGWPDNPSVFLRTNIALHLLNGLLVAWFLYLLGRARNKGERPAAIAAAAAASIWMLMPLLASSSLFIVQRMTTLSATFALLGAVGYMHARISMLHRPIRTLVGMTFFLGLGALLSMLTKENGALIFLFILAAEATLLNRPGNISPILWRSWFFIVLLGPLVAITIFLFSAVPYSEDIVLRRGFTSLERLATQAEILWKYLYLAFIPNVADLGPFHDDHPVRRDLLNVVTVFSVTAWVAVIVVAVKFRHKLPLFSFAITWYLLGHLLESTWLNLELYFEHRNYLPLVGPVYALMVFLIDVGKKWRTLIVIGAVGYAGLLGAILFSLTSLWGSPGLAAEMWHIHKPASMRAAYNLAQQLQKQGDFAAAGRLLERYMKENTERQVFTLETLILSCQVDQNANQNESAIKARQALGGMPFRHGVDSRLVELYDLAVRQDQCPHITAEEIYGFGQRILANPNFAHNALLHNVHLLLARIGVERRDFSLTMEHIESALDLVSHPSTLALAIQILNSGGRQDISRNIFNEAKKRPLPKNPIVAYRWQRELRHLEEMLHATKIFDQQSDSQNWSDNESN